MKTWKIYKHTNLINGKSYIGQTSAENPNQRWSSGYGYSRRNPVFYNAIKKYGWDNFSHEIIEDNIKSLEEANEREIYWIKYYHTWIKDPECNGYNTTSGGSGRSHEQSEETKQKISSTLKGRVFSKEHLEKINKTLRRKEIICIETGVVYESISEAARQTGISRENIKTAINGQRLSAGGFHWALTVDLQTQENLRSLNGKCKASKRKILCVETGESYESITSAAKIIGVNQSAISIALKRGSRVKGFHWEYLD